MASHFSNSEWKKINTLYKQATEKDYGLPKRRNDSVVIGSFNIRKLGVIANKTDQSWEFIKNIIERFDLIAIQEVMDNLSGLEHLLFLLGNNYGMVVSDITGSKPGSSGNAERLGYLFNWKRIQRTALASDITFDRSEITNNLYDDRFAFNEAWTAHTKKLKEWEKDIIKRKAEGKKKPGKPPIELPKFVSFIRQPHCVSFRIKGKKKAKPIELLAVNAHLLFGKNKDEREWEFDALLGWLAIRAKNVSKLYHPNILLLGDCNLDFDTVPAMKTTIDAKLKNLNKTFLKNKKSAKANFPILSTHPRYGILKTALREKSTYDQIGIFSNDPRLPTPDDNLIAGTKAGHYNYGVFNIANLFANALHGKNMDQVTKKQKSAIYKKAEHDITDHMPIWMRIRRPGQ